MTRRAKPWAISPFVAEETCKMLHSGHGQVCSVLNLAIMDVESLIEAIDEAQRQAEKAGYRCERAGQLRKDLVAIAAAFKKAARRRHRLQALAEYDRASISWMWYRNPANFTKIPAATAGEDQKDATA